MIRFYKATAKILRTLKSYLTGAVLKMKLLFLIILRYVKLVTAFCKFTKNKKPVDKKRGVLDSVVLVTDGVSVWIEEIDSEFWQQERQKHFLSL